MAQPLSAGTMAPADVAPEASASAAIEPANGLHTSGLMASGAGADSLGQSNSTGTREANSQVQTQNGSEPQTTALVEEASAHSGQLNGQPNHLGVTNAMPATNGHVENHSAPGPSYTSSSKPPYTAPSDTIYPNPSVPNEHLLSTAPQPAFDNLPAGSLYRPARLPAELDERMCKESIWMGVHKDTAEAIYFVPPACTTCTKPSVNTYCDRAYPTCGRCRRTGSPCVFGKHWTQLRPPSTITTTEPARQESIAQSNGVNGTVQGPDQENGERRYSAAQKGKGRASENGVNKFEEDNGRGKRVKKKRRLSATGEVDPESLNADGTVIKKRKQAKASISTSTGTSHQHQHQQLHQVPLEGPLSPEDQAYFDRIEENGKKPRLSEMRATCPVWSTTRKGLQAAAEYLRNPSKTAGASVEIGVGGVARGVILEGVPPSSRCFWGVQEDAGTIMVPIGTPRRRRPVGDTKPSGLNVDEAIGNESPENHHITHEDRTTARARSPAINILPSVIQLDDNLASPTESPQESREVSALLMAQRARTPIAIALGQDYPIPRFKIPRPFIVLGWFWVIDAWLEPVYTSDDTFDRDSVVWKFRFSICDPSPSACWWQHKSDTPPLKLPRLDNPSSADEKWSLDPSCGSLSTTVDLDRTHPQVEDDDSTTSSYTCPQCRAVSRRVYYSQDICLNETCEAWFFEANTSSTTWKSRPPEAKRAIPGSPIPLIHISPDQLGLRLRPPEPNANSMEVSRNHAGREFWRGWVCGSCGMANERRKWHGWDCEACGNYIAPKRKEWTESQLRPPSRPVATGPRQEDGFASWPFEATRAWTLFRDDIKVIKHGLSAGFGEGTEVYHAMNHEGNNVHIMARETLRQLQAQGPSEIPLRRPLLVQSSRRPAERYLSPFYTILCGPEPAPPIEALPANKSIPWVEAPTTCIDVADLINERAGRMFPGEPERFNSLMIVVCPPDLPAAQQPRIFVPPYSHMAFLFLGSDGTLKFRRAALGQRTGKQGELTLQHGDVVGIKTGVDGVEVQPCQDGFGSFCLARQLYRDDPEADDLSQDVPTGPDGQPIKDKAKSTNRPPPRPTKLLEVPLTYWYIGPYPLDSTQPIRALPPMRSRPEKPPALADEQPESTKDEVEMIPSGDQVTEPVAAAVPVTGSTERSGKNGESASVEGPKDMHGRRVQIYESEPVPPTTLDPPAIPADFPRGGDGSSSRTKKDKENGKDKENVNGKGKEKVPLVNGKEEDRHTGGTKGKKRDLDTASAASPAKKKKRKSGVTGTPSSIGTGVAAEVQNEDEMSIVVDGSEGGSGKKAKRRSTGKGKGKGRGSLAASLVEGE